MKMEGKSEIASTARVEIRNPSGGFQDETTGGEEKNERNIEAETHDKIWAARLNGPVNEEKPSMETASAMG